MDAMEFDPELIVGKWWKDFNIVPSKTLWTKSTLPPSTLAGNIYGHRQSTTSEAFLTPLKEAEHFWVGTGDWRGRL